MKRKIRERSNHQGRNKRVDRVAPRVQGAHNQNDTIGLGPLNDPCSWADRFHQVSLEVFI